MTIKNVYIKFLDTRVGRFFINYFYISILPLTILGLFLISFIMDEPTIKTSGKITRSFMDVAIIKNYGKSSIGKPSSKINCLFIELDDSTIYMVKYSSFKNALKNKEIIGRKVQIQYHLVERYKMPEALAVFYYDDNNKEYAENLLPYRQIEKIIFDDGQVIKSSSILVFFIIIGFVLSLIWLICGLAEDIIKTWKHTPNNTTKLITTSNFKNIAGKLIKDFKNCPACGFKLNNTDNECPDCGLNFK